MENQSLLAKCVLALLFVAGVSFAATLSPCAANAYQDACAHCSFDANGKMDQSCYQAKQAAGTACISTSYPIAAAKYAEGNCTDIDTCASELTACKAKYATGNDSQDCDIGAMRTCFNDADVCVYKAAQLCETGGISVCPTAAMAIIVVGIVFAAAFIRKQ